MCDYLAINSNFFDYCTYALVKYFQLEEYTQIHILWEIFDFFSVFIYLHRVEKTRKVFNTHTYTDSIMPTRTICISEEAYEKLKSLKTTEKNSFSDVILKYYPKKRKLSEVLAEIGTNPELADAIEKASRDMRKAETRKVDLDAGAWYFFYCRSPERQKRSSSETGWNGSSGIPLSKTEINVIELYRGAYLSRKTHQNLEEIKKLLECFQVLELEESVYKVFASLSANLLSKGTSIGAFDELIAAITLFHGERIVTRDSHFKEVTGLEVIVYW